jgi:hypothetical protein
MRLSIGGHSSATPEWGVYLDSLGVGAEPARCFPRLAELPGRELPENLVAPSCEGDWKYSVPSKRIAA